MTTKKSLWGTLQKGDTVAILNQKAWQESQSLNAIVSRVEAGETITDYSNVEFNLYPDHHDGIPAKARLAPDTLPAKPLPNGWFELQ